MNLTEEPEIVDWPEFHYVFIEKIAPFEEIAQAAKECWSSLHSIIPTISQHNKIVGYTSLYKCLSEKQQYRAGVRIAEEPVDLPKDVDYVKFGGGHYSRFVLTGSYSHIPEACRRIFGHIIKEKGIKTSDNFNLENYVNDPRITPENELITELLIATE